MRERRARSPLGPIRCQQGAATSRGLEIGITHTASNPACAAARGVRRPPGSSRSEGARVCGCAGARVEAVWVRWWGGGVRGAGQHVRVVPGAGWAGVPEASGRAESPSREAASAVRASSCPAAAAASRSGRPARPSPRGSSQATAAAAAPPLRERLPCLGASRTGPGRASSARAPAPCSDGACEYG